MEGKIKIMVYDKSYKHVWVTDTEKCGNRKCFKPHNCYSTSIEDAKAKCLYYDPNYIGTDDGERWMCLTNFYSGCPDDKDS